MWQSTSNNSSSQMQTPDGSAGYNYYYGDGSSYNQNNLQPQSTSAQIQGYQPAPQAVWGQTGQDGTVVRQAMPNNVNGPSMQALSGTAPPNYNGYCGDRNYYSNHGSNNVQHGQGLWGPPDPTKTLPSPVFRNDPPNYQPHMWPATANNNMQSSIYPSNDAGSNNNYQFSNNQYHHCAQEPRTPSQGYQPMQFTMQGYRPSFSGQRGRGFFPPNQRGGRGARGRGNGNAPSRGRGRAQTLMPTKSSGKVKEGKLFCDPCERLFNNEEQLAKHVSEHRTCGIDGCKLTAHTSVVDKHIKMQHETGLFLKMKDMVNSNDFAKWRAERKLRYPSKENIVKRQAEQDEKLKRGESLGNENGRFPRNRGGNSKRGQRSGRGSWGRNGNNEIDTTQSESEQNLFPQKKTMGRRGRKRGRGGGTPLNDATVTTFARSIDEEQIQDSQANEERDFSDTEWEPVAETATGTIASVPKLSSALNTLASMYDSDSDKESEAGQVKSETIPNGVSTNGPIGVDVQDENDVPTEVPICRNAPETTELEDSEVPRNISHKRKHNRNNQNPHDKPKHGKMNNRGDRNSKGCKPRQSVTLLEKLLSGEIRHERNVILQCIRYIVENNFLQGVEPTSTELANTQTISKPAVHLEGSKDATDLSSNTSK